jgi:hypothetical protein
MGGWTPPTLDTSGTPDGSQLDADYAAATQGLADAKQAVQDAVGRYQQLYQDFNQAKTDAQDPSNTNAAQELQAAYQAFDTAQRDLGTANTAYANASARVASAAESAAARPANNPALKAYYQAHANQANASGALATNQSLALQATTPEQVKNLAANTTKTLQDAQDAGLITPAQVEQIKANTSQITSQTATADAIRPYVVQQQKAAATTATAQANLAPEAAQAAVDKAQAEVDQTKTQTQQLAQTLANTPTTSEAHDAIQLQLQQATTDLATKQQALEQARQLMPIAVAGAQANVGQTLATTQATQAGAVATLAGVAQKTLGPLYGVGDQITKLRGMIANGQIQPEDASTALNTYLNSQLQGATPFQQAQEANTYNLSNRTLDVNQANTRLQAGASYAGNTMGMFGQLAAGAGPGHGAAMAAGLQAALNMGRQYFAQLGGLTNTPAAPNAMSQAPTVHINIGSGQPTSADTTQSQPQQPVPAINTTQPAGGAAVPGTGGIAGANANLGGAPSGGMSGDSLDWQAATAAMQNAGNTSGLPNPMTMGNNMTLGGVNPGLQMPAFASGGVVTKPTVALIGEAGPEAVVPLGHTGDAIASHPSVLAALAAHPGATPNSPWGQHVSRWRNEIASGKVSVAAARGRP